MKSSKFLAFCHFESDDSLVCGKCPLLDSNKLNNQTKKSKNINENRYCKFYQEKYAHNVKNNINYHEILNDERLQKIPLMPILTIDWFQFDLSYLITNNYVITNLNNLTSFSKLPDTLRSIEINNFGIESITRNALKYFRKLNVLRLAYNNLNMVDLASLVTDNTESTLIELDLSHNKLSSIKFENFVYLESLLALNFSNNLLKNFDFRFMAIICPRLKILDLSFNLLRNVKILHNQILAQPLASNSSSNNSSMNVHKLESNLILSSLNFLNLDGNYLNDFKDLFSINLNSINDYRFCNHAFFRNDSVNVFDFNEFDDFKASNNKLNIKIQNNAWKCDCETMELVLAIADINKLNLVKNSTGLDFLNDLQLIAYNFTDSCYLNQLLNRNKFLFDDYLSNLSSANSIFNKCYPKSDSESPFYKNNSISWLTWYRKFCLKENFTENTSSTPFFIQPTNSTEFVNSSNSSSTRIQKLSKILLDQIQIENTPLKETTTSISSTTTTTSRFSIPNSTRLMFLRYDLSNVFYWILSICFILITITCISTVWMYCWRRYCKSKNVLMINNGQIRRGNRESSRSQSINTNNYLHNQRARSNIPNSHDPQSLYFLSLNSNNQNRVYYENRAPLPNRSERRGVHLENINTDAYSSSIDDPPDYYEVTSIKKSKYDTNKKRLSSISLSLARVSLNENASPTPATSNQLTTFNQPSSNSLSLRNNS
jgi:hypothetical protein